MNKALLFVLFLLIAGCSGGPGSNDIANAMEEQVKAGLLEIQKFSSVWGLTAPEPDISIKVLKIEDMRQAESGDYIANVTYHISLGGEEKKESARLTFTKVDDRWKIINSQKL